MCWECVKADSTAAAVSGHRLLFIAWDLVICLSGSEIKTHALSASNIKQHNTKHHSTTQHNTTQNNTAQHNTLPIQTLTTSDAAPFPALQQQTMLQSVCSICAVSTDGTAGKRVFFYLTNNFCNFHTILPRALGDLFIWPRKCSQLNEGKLKERTSDNPIPLCSSTIPVQRCQGECAHFYELFL